MSNLHVKKTDRIASGFDVAYLSAANKTHQWSIADDIASTPGSPRLHYPMDFNGQSTRTPDNFSMEYDKKIEEIKNLLRSKREEEPIDRLMFVDAIQRLGVNHNFEELIETILRNYYESTSANICGFHTLHDVSLFFRLMRQHGYDISSDVFNKFKGDDGRFRGELQRDTRGLMELYEASQLRFEGEYTLDEAESFSSQNLNKYLADMDCSSCRLVTNKLQHPYRKSIGRLTTRYDFRGKNQWGKTLHELAAMDLRMRKSEYQKELFQVSEWWKELRIAENLSLARNQPLKWYTCSMAILIDDITLSEQRIELTKSITFIYLIDDIFDVYGSPEELVIFAEAVSKWDYAAVETLPDYMKLCYKSLLDTTNEIGYKIYEKYGYNPIDSLKTTWASLCNAFLEEAKWFASGNLPNATKYLENGKVSSGVYVVMVHLFFLLGLGGTCGSAIHLNDTSKLMSSVATILRLWDDLGSAKDEHQDGKDGSYIECYMKEHISLSTEQAQQHAIDLISSEWKLLNKECFNLNHVSTSSIKKAALNTARMVPLMYSYDENQGLPILEEYVKIMLFD
uniref:Nerolidol/linalool synthase 1 n=1 Tax=Antirrhinum majus TaxID=4151 RepID=B1NA83_ANTMA|nr:nerolidol/linalool synthase 1 [Antirrhinum majus]